MRFSIIQRLIGDFMSCTYRCNPFTTSFHFVKWQSRSKQNMKFSSKNGKPLAIQIYQQLELVRNLGKNLIITNSSINHAIKKLCDAFHVATLTLGLRLIMKCKGPWGRKCV
jgi:hypothetical protein